MTALQDLFDKWVGLGRRIRTEDFAREVEYSQRAVIRWVNEGCIPELEAIRNMLAAVALPIEFRKELAAFLTRRCSDLKVVFDAEPVRAEPHPNPLRLTFDLDAAVLDVQRSIERALCEHGAGGANVTETEQAEVEQFLTAVERLTAESRRAVRAKVQRRTA
jgi:hypothetical protein